MCASRKRVFSAENPSPCNKRGMSFLYASEVGYRLRVSFESSSKIAFAACSTSSSRP